MVTGEDLRETRVAEIAPEEFMRMFALVMHEWDFRPFRRGQVAMPTEEEAVQKLAASRYNQ